MDSDPSEYILGFTVGNDISARDWQTQEAAGGQHFVAKSFDQFAPLGPVIASYKAVGDPGKLTLETYVNGERRQHAQTDDLIHSLQGILATLTRGKTLRQGTVVMTGTPSGVAAFMEPQTWLQDGDVVEVTITAIGSIRNRISFNRI